MVWCDVMCCLFVLINRHLAFVLKVGCVDRIRDLRQPVWVTSHEVYGQDFEFHRKMGVEFELIMFVIILKLCFLQCEQHEVQ